MKKLALISVVAAAMLFIGCEGKREKEVVKKEVVKKEVKKSEPIKDVLPGMAPQSSQKEKVSSSSSLESKPQAKEVAKKSIDGAKLFLKCASCHGAKGDRKALNKSALIGGMSKEELVKKLKGYKSGKLDLYKMGGLMKTQVANMSDEELEALADYISKLK
jgi:cytochrome c553